MIHWSPQKLEVKFFITEGGKEPVRDWLRALEPGARKRIGEDIAKVQYGWPVGMPLVKPLRDGLWEVRSNLRDATARVLFICQGHQMILLHGFIKKSRATPQKELELARWRAVEARQGDLF